MSARRAFLCLPALPARAATALTLAYTVAPQFGGALIAKEQKFFEKRGLDVTLQLITLSTNVPATLVSGSAQVGGVTPPWRSRSWASRRPWCSR